MDAVEKLIKNIVIYAAVAFFCVTPGRSQSQLSATPSSVALSGTTLNVQVIVSGSGPFSVINQVGSFFSINPDSLTAPTNLNVGLASTLCSNGGVTCNGSFTLHPTSASGGGSDVTVPVSFTPGGGAGGGTNGTISANPPSVTLNTNTGQSVASSVSLSTASTAPVSFSVTTTPANNTSWLSVALNNTSVSASSPVTMSVFGNATNIFTTQTGSITITPLGGGTQTVIPVTLNVNGTSGSTYSVSPTSVALAYPGGPVSQTLVIFSNNSAINTFNATATNCNGTNFLTLTGGTASGVQIFNQPTASNLSLTLNNPASLATGSYSCQVFVSNPSNSSDQAVVTVSLTVNGGGSSGGGFALNPSSVSFQSTSGSTNTQPTAIQLSSSVQSTYNATFTSNSSPNGTNSWISINGQGTTVTNQQVTGGLSIALNNPQSFNVGTYSGTVTISNPNTSGTATLAVNLTVSSSGSTGNSYTLNINSATFQYPFGQQSASVYVSSGTQNSFIASTSVSGGVANWLLLTQNGISGTAITGVTGNGTTNPLTVSLNPNAVPQLSGTYTGQVKIANPSNSNDFALVTITLNQGSNSGSGGFSVSPSSLTFNTPVGVTPGQQTIGVTTPTSSSTFSTSIQANSGTLFITSPCNGCQVFTGGQNLIVTVTPGSLPAGTYTNTINLVSNGSTFASIPVTLSVGSTGGGTSAIAAPTTLSFFYQAGQASTPPSQTISIAPSGIFTASASQSWIAVSPGSGSGPGNVIVSVIPQGFAAGTSNQGFVSIATPSGNQTVTVNLTVSSGVVLYSNPGSINLTTPNYVAGLTVSASDNSSQAVSVTTSTPWISISSATNTATTPASFLVTVTPSGLCNGLNTGSVTATGSGASNSPLTIPVTVLISGNSSSTCGSTSGPLTLSTSTLNFTAASNGPTQTQTLTVTPQSTSTFFTVTTSLPSGQNWLSVPSPCNFCSGSSSYNMQVQVNPTGLAAGTYSGTIAFNTGGTVQNVQVNLTVGTSGGSGNITASPTSLSFAAQVNGSAPAGQTVSVASQSGTAVGYIYQVSTTNGSTNWLSASAGGTALTNGQGLTTPTTLTVTANPTGLTTGTYNGTITLSPNGGSAVQIPVTLSVQNNVVSSSPTSVTFNYTAGTSAPSAQTVQVTSPTPGLTFSAQVASGNCANGWLLASPTTGTTPQNVSISLNTANLVAGTCTGSVTITGTGGASGSTTVNVTANVTAPLPTITQVGSAASYIGTSISPGEIITIFGTGLGPTPFVTTALDASGKVATTLGGVQVLVAGFPAPMVFAGNTQVSAVVPYEVAQLRGSQPVVVKFLGQSSNAIGVQISPTAPGIFTANASGTGPGAILNPDSSVNSPSNPAAKGATVAIYMTGEGLTSPTQATGAVTPGTLPAPQVTPAPLLPVAVLLDGQPAAIAYAGEAPKLVAGVLQVNVQIPATARTGDLPLVISIGGTSSQTGVTVSVR